MTWKRFNRLRRKPHIAPPTSEGAVAFYLLVAWLCIVAIIWLAIRHAAAQHNHDSGHHEYLNWASRKVANCCNNRDCGSLTDDDIRNGAEGQEIKIAGEWCPVRHEHYLVRGRSPDLSVPHACIGTGPAWIDRPPCERLLCFVDRGGA